MVVVLGEENNRILLPENLYKCATFYLFLSLHFVPEELTRVGSVLSAYNPKHRNAGLTPFQQVPMFSQKCQRFRIEHPFTSMIAGMTGSGKNGLG